MKKSIFLALFVAISIGLLGFGADVRAGGAESESTILTVKAVLVHLDLGGGRLDIQGLKLTDGEGNKLDFPGEANEWFENARAEPLTIKDGAFFFKFFVNGRFITIGVGEGTKFAVQKTKAGKYILLPEETVKLSPPSLDKK